MLLRCVAATGADLGPHKRGGYYFPATRFELTPGKVYPVFAMMMINSGLVVLTKDDYEKPFWFPLQAFTVEDPSIPESWLFRFFPEVEPGGMPGEYMPEAIWGYPEIVQSDKHNDELMDRDSRALAIFRREAERYNLDHNG